MKIEEKVVESVNRPGRVGVLATADAEGRPNADGTLIMGMMSNRSLKNLEQNPLAVFFTVDKAPVDFQTPGWRLYLKVREIQRQGPILDNIRDGIAKRAGAEAAKKMQAGVVFEVTNIRPLVDVS
jgi:predicted pyridoxine 5'-phosphate oxidase superfamily flavin-nucleotide-binding protein